MVLCSIFTSVPGLFHLTCSPSDSSMLLQMARFPFLRMNNIVFYGLFKPLGIDFIGNKIDISEGYDDIYTLERYI